MEAHKLYKETGEALTKSMKILNLKCCIRDTSRMANIIEPSRTSFEANNTFQNYINFLAEGVTSKNSRAAIFKHSETNKSQ